MEETTQKIESPLFDILTYDYHSIGHGSRDLGREGWPSGRIPA